MLARGAAPQAWPFASTTRGAGRGSRRAAGPAAGGSARCPCPPPATSATASRWQSLPSPSGYACASRSARPWWGTAARARARGLLRDLAAVGGEARTRDRPRSATPAGPSEPGPALRRGPCADPWPAPVASARDRRARCRARGGPVAAAGCRGRRAAVAVPEARARPRLRSQRSQGGPASRPRRALERLRGARGRREGWLEERHGPSRLSVDGRARSVRRGQPGPREDTP